MKYENLNGKKSSERHNRQHDHRDTSNNEMIAITGHSVMNNNGDNQYSVAGDVNGGGGGKVELSHNPWGNSIITVRNHSTNMLPIALTNTERATLSQIKVRQRISIKSDEKKSNITRRVYNYSKGKSENEKVSKDIKVGLLS